MRKSLLGVWTYFSFLLMSHVKIIEKYVLYLIIFVYFWTHKFKNGVICLHGDYGSLDS